MPGERLIPAHLFTEHSLFIAGNDANSNSVEHMPWFVPLFYEPLEIEQGEKLISDRAGIGFGYNRDALRKYTI